MTVMGARDMQLIAVCQSPADAFIGSRFGNAELSTILIALEIRGPNMVVE